MAIKTGPFLFSALGTISKNLDSIFEILGIHGVLARAYLAAVLAMGYVFRKALCL